MARADGGVRRNSTKRRFRISAPADGKPTASKADGCARLCDVQSRPSRPERRKSGMDGPTFFRGVVGLGVGFPLYQSDRQFVNFRS